MILSYTLIHPRRSFEHIEYVTQTYNLQHSCAHFILKFYEKCSRTDGFLYDLIMILDSSLLFQVFWATLYDWLIG